MWAVVTIPQREAMADDLLRQLRPPAIKVVDAGGDIQRNHIRAWREVCGLGGDWVGVLQDDLILCEDFDRKVRRRLAEADGLGYRAVSFYNNAHVDQYLVRLNDRWGQMDMSRIQPIRRDGGTLKSPLQGELCVAVRRDLALRYGEFVAAHGELYQRFPGIHDGLFGLFLNAAIEGAPDPQAVPANHVYVALPNLVDHRADIPSSQTHESHRRVRRSSSFRRDAD
jgi:hypothetical protein